MYIIHNRQTKGTGKNKASSVTAKTYFMCKGFLLLCQVYFVANFMLVCQKLS